MFSASSAVGHQWRRFGWREPLKIHLVAVPASSGSSFLGSSVEIQIATVPQKVSHRCQKPSRFRGIKFVLGRPEPGRAHSLPVTTSNETTTAASIQPLGSSQTSEPNAKTLQKRNKKAPCISHSRVGEQSG